jgi:hypothetical protein
VAHPGFACLGREQTAAVWAFYIRLVNSFRTWFRMCQDWVTFEVATGGKGSTSKCGPADTGAEQDFTQPRSTRGSHIAGRPLRIAARFARSRAALLSGSGNRYGRAGSGGSSCSRAMLPVLRW